MNIAFRTQAGLDIRERALKTGDIRFLRQVTDRCPLLHSALTLVRLHQSGGDLEQRRFARAVTAHKAQPLAFRYRQFGTVQEGWSPEGQMDVAKDEERRGHGLKSASKGAWS